MRLLAYCARGLLAAALVAGCTKKGDEGGGSGDNTTPSDTVAVTISPKEATVKVGQTQQFSASVTGSSNTAVTWSVNPSSGGSVDGAGLFTASSAPGEYSVVATSAADSTKSATAKVVVEAVDPGEITVDVSSPVTQIVAGGKVQLTVNVTNSSAGVEWTFSPAACGSVSATNEFTAGATLGDCVVTATTVEGDKTDSVTITIKEEGQVEISVSVTSPVSEIVTGGKVQLTVNVTNSVAGVDWTFSPAACGSVSGSNEFTAGATLGPCEVTATTKEGNKTDSVTITIKEQGQVVVTVELTTPTTQVVTGGKVQLTVNVTNSVAGVDWSFAPAACGSVSGSNEFTAGNTPGDCEVTATTREGAKTDSVTITIQEKVITVELSGPAEVEQNKKVQLTVNVTNSTQGVNWSFQPAACGSVSATNEFTGLIVGDCKVTATTKEGGKTDDVTIKVTRPAPTVVLELDPASARVRAGKTFSFIAQVTGAANQRVIWSVREGAAGGTVNDEGIYTAPSTPGEYHVVATAAADDRVFKEAVVTVDPAVTVTLSPKNVRLEVLKTVTFTVNVTGTDNTNITWEVSPQPGCGTITTATRVYTAPSAPKVCTVKATSTEDSSVSDSVTVTVVPSIVVTVSPTPDYVSIGHQTKFTAKVTNATDMGVEWSLGADAQGSISAEGVYTAPSTPGGPYTIQATSLEDRSKVGLARVTVLPMSVQVIGTVAYTGPRQGRIFVGVSVDGGNTFAAGTSLAAPGAFTIQGVPKIGAGAGYFIQAFVDVDNRSVRNDAGSPEARAQWSMPGGLPAGFNVGTLTLAAPEFEEPPAAPSEGVQAGVFNNLGLLSFEERLRDEATGVELAESYVVYWTTTPPVEGNPATYPGPTNNVGFKVLPPGSNAVLNTFTPGSSYYFAYAGRNAFGEGAVSPITGPIQALVPAGAPATTIKGTIETEPYQPGRFYLVAFDSQGNPVGGTNVLAQPGPVDYTIEGVPPLAPPECCAAFLVIYLDVDDDGLIAERDVARQGGVDRVPPGGRTGINIKIGAPDTAPGVMTVRSEVDGVVNYEVLVQVAPGSKHVVAASVVEPGTASPRSLPLFDPTSPGLFAKSFSLGVTTPVAGMFYPISVTYRDGGNASFEPHITSYFTTAPTIIAPANGAVASLTPTFNWSLVEGAVEYQISLIIALTNGTNEQRFLVWRSDAIDVADAADGVEYNFDGTAALDPLWAENEHAGISLSYEWILRGFDEDANSTLTFGRFRVPRK